ncbi:Hsp20 heat shock protein [Synechococcus phage S-SRM01]|uniref:Heat-shock protein n=1 Tax=Synechococcus phage S-SRM01 TaxID=2781608 RepID=A0A879R416_9CAUD|nr:Hsp20 heat shock protein [Synechococcus phage S-SRM01]QPX48210.1 heat-shock protein [Synechococcus phage S-SRM01]
MPKGFTKHKLAFKGDAKMTNLTRYTAADLPALMERITRNSIGMDEYFDRLFNLHETTSNYPPYNLVQVSNVESRLEIALAGFKKSEVNVFTEYGKLFVEGQKEDKETDTQYVHKGLAQRSFKRAWTIADDTEVKDVVFEDGLLSIELRKIIPQHHQRKDYL